MSESDDESFVVLGTSPSNSSINEEYVDPPTNETTANKSINISASQQLMEISSQTEPFQSFHQSKIIENVDTSSSSSSTLSQILSNLKNDIPPTVGVSSLKELASSSSGNATSTKWQLPAEAMMTSSINADEILLAPCSNNNNGINQSIYEQFPSLRISQPNAEDMAKLETVIGENIDLKQNLQKTNLAMRQHFAMINKWQQNVKSVRDNQLIQLEQNKETIQKCNEQIAYLKNELSMKNDAIELNQDIVAEKIYKLETELNKQSAQIVEMNEKIVQLQNELMENKKEIDAVEIRSKMEREKLTNEIEEYRAMIELMNAQIDRLEKSSFQIINDSLLPTNNNDSLIKLSPQTNDDLLAKLAAYEKYFTDNMTNSMAKENDMANTIEKSNDRMESFVKMSNENLLASMAANIAVHESVVIQTEHLPIQQKLVGSQTQNCSEQTEETSKLLAENMELKEKVHKFQQLEDENQKLQLQINELQIQLKAITMSKVDDEASTSTTDLLSIANHKVDTLEMEKRSLKNSIIEMKTITEMLRKEIEDMKVANTKVTELQAAHDNMEVVVNLVNKENLELCSQMKELQSFVQTKDDAIKQFEDETNETINQIQELEQEKEKLQKELFEIQSLTQSKDDIIEQLQKESKIDRENNECVHAIYTSTNDLLDSANNKVHSLEMEKRSLENSIVEMENITEMLRKQIERDSNEKNLELIKLRDEILALQVNDQKNEKIERYQTELAEITEHANAANIKITQLQSSNNGLENVIKSSSITIADLREEGNLLREQMELYRIDYEAEKKARLDITAEREEILSDLKLLQRRNQQLFDEAKKRNAFVPPTTSSTATNTQTTDNNCYGGGQSSSSNTKRDENYSCCYCNSTYTNLPLLLKHVNICQDNN